MQLVGGGVNAVWGRSTTQCSPNPTNWVDPGYQINVNQRVGTGTPSWTCGWTYDDGTHPPVTNQPYYRYSSVGEPSTNFNVDIIPSIGQCNTVIVSVQDLGCVFFRRSKPNTCLGSKWCTIGDISPSYPADGSDYAYDTNGCNYIIGRLGHSIGNPFNNGLPVLFGSAGVNSCTFNSNVDDGYHGDIQAGFGSVPAPTCRIWTNSGSYNVKYGTSATLNYSGFSFANMTQLWASQAVLNGAGQIPQLPGEQGGGGGYYYLLSQCAGGWCPASSYTTPTNLPVGLYYLWCDTAGGGDKCSGNPRCTYHGGPFDCSPWRFCSSEDLKVLAVDPICSSNADCGVSADPCFTMVCVNPGTSSAYCNKVNNPVNGYWSYGDWGACSVACGFGTQTRTASCIPPQCGGAACGDSSTSQGCRGDTPVNGTWLYTPYSACSATCGGGTRTRTTIACSGAACGGNCDTPVTSEVCNTQLCQCSTPPYTYRGSCNLDNQCAANAGKCINFVCSCVDELSPGVPNTCTTDTCTAGGTCTNINSYNWNTTPGNCDKTCGAPGSGTRTPTATCKDAGSNVDATGACCPPPTPSTAPVSCDPPTRWCACNDSCSEDADCVNGLSCIDTHTSGGYRCRRNACETNPNCPLPSGTWAPCTAGWGLCTGAACGGSGTQTCNVNTCNSVCGGTCGLQPTQPCTTPACGPAPVSCDVIVGFGTATGPHCKSIKINSQGLIYDGGVVTCP